MIFFAVKNSSAMKKKTTILDFCNAFNTEEKCFAYLCEIKWGKGFSCRRCGHEIANKGRTWYYRRCQKCKYDESCTAHTLFHKLKFPVTRAFMIVHQISTMKKGLSTCEISRQFHIHQETAWFFKRKVQEAMNIGSSPEFNKIVEVPGGQISSAKSFTSEKNRCENEDILVTVMCQKSDAKKPKAQVLFVGLNGSKMEGQKWNKAMWADGQPNSSAEIQAGLKIKLRFRSREKGSIMKWYIFNLRNWVRGIHHFISLAHLQRYLNEYQYRFDRRAYSMSSPSEILMKMVDLPWLPYSIAKAS